jgi:hypothetical protein
MQLNEKCIYICLATQHAKVSVLPITELSRSEVDKAYILCAGTAESNDNGTKKNALNPARNIQSFLASRQIPNATVYAATAPDADDAAYWEKQVKIIIEAHPDKKLLLNISGGRTQTKLGAWEAASRSGGLILTVEGNPLRTQFIQRTNEGLKTVLSDPATGGQKFTLQELVQLENHALSNNQFRLEKERRALARVTQSNEFIRILRDTPNNEADPHKRYVKNIQALNQGCATVGLSEDRHPKRLEKNRVDKNWIGFSLLKVPELFTGIKDSDTSITFINDFEWKYLSGGWFEEHLFAELTEKARGKPDISIYHGLEFVVAAKPGKSEPATRFEVDIAVKNGSQLHYVEVKTANFSSKDQRRKAIDQVTTLKEVAGQFGKVFLINPTATSENMRAGDTRLKINYLGAHSLIGQSCIHDLMKGLGLD